MNASFSWFDTDITKFKRNIFCRKSNKLLFRILYDLKFSQGTSDNHGNYKVHLPISTIQFIFHYLVD